MGTEQVGANSARRVWFHAGVICVLMLLTAVIYSPVRHYGFVDFDDPENIYRESHVLTGPTAQNVHWAMTAFQMGHWVPLTRLTYLLDQRYVNLNPGVMHVEDVLLHLACGVALYAMLVTMTGAPLRSSVVAVLFAVHPMHVESVVWITERRDVLSTFLLLLAVLAYVHFARERGLKRKWLWYAAAIACYGLSLTAKAMGITLPAVLLLLDLWPLQRPARGVRWGRLLLEKIPFALLSLPVAVVAARAQVAVGATATLSALPVSARLANAVVTYVLYLCKLTVPTGLSVMYVLPAQTRPAEQVLPALVLLAMLVGFAFRSKQRRPYLIVGAGWFFITLLPVIGLLQSGAQAMADRYSYLPSIGFFICVVWGACDLAGIFFRRRLFAAAAIMTAVTIVALTWTARAQVGYWQTTRALFEHSKDVTQDNWFALYHIGLDEAEQKHYAAAMRLFSQSISLNPSYADTYLDYGNCLYLASPASALPSYETAVRMAPNNARAHASRGNARLATGDLIGARADYIAAVRLEPDSIYYRQRLAAADQALSGK